MAGCECCDNFSMIDGGDEFKAFPGLKGEDGKSAYQAAVEGGFIGTEAEFNTYLSGIGDLTALVDRKAGALVDTASGAIASFVPDATIDNLLGVSVAVEPVQAGSGDPSPDNVRPISGWSAVGIESRGQNLFAFSEVKSKQIYRANILPFTGSNNSCYLTGAAGATETNQLLVSSWAVVSLQMSANPLKTETKVTLSCNIQNFTDLGGATGFVKLSYCDANFANLVDGAIATFSAIGKTPISISATIPAGKYLCVRATPVSKGTEVTLSQYTEMTDIQLEIGTTASAFKPYTGNTYTIALGQTVYGGTLDVTAGKMYTRPYFPSYNGQALIGPWVSSMDAYTPGASPTVGAQVVDMGGAVTEITLDPVTISTISGQTNNLWSDAGDVTVEFAADLKHYIDSKIAAAVAALS